MSKKDQKKLMVIEKFRDGLYSRTEAAAKLKLSPRQISRIAKRVREVGIKGVKHGNYGKTPWNKVPDSLVNEYVSKYEEMYSNFNYSHALEMMAIHNEMDKLSYTNFRKACRRKGIGKVKKRRTSKARIAREREYEEGAMWQLDGSPHMWDGKKISCLIALIDDATSKIPNAELHPTETTWACLNVVRLAIERYGAPEFILTDKAGWSEGSSRKRKHFSQFERACLELDITVIATSSPESKGRVERLNRTFQDRLIPELELFGIKGLKDCNRYLQQVFNPSWNEKFIVEAKATTTRYRRIECYIDLKEIFCMKYERVVNRNHTVNYDGKMYVIFPEPGRNYKKKTITIHKYEDGKISIYYSKKKLVSSEMDQPKRRWRKTA